MQGLANPDGESPQDNQDWDRRRRRMFLLFSGLLVLGLALLAGKVLLPFIMAVIVAYVLAPVCAALGPWMPRWVAVGTVYLTLLGLLGLFTAMGVPRLVVEVESLAGELPSALSTMENRWLPQLEARIRSSLEEQGKTTSGTDNQGATKLPEDTSTDTAMGLEPQVSQTRLRIESTPEQGVTEVVLPEGGIVVTKEGKHTYRIGSNHDTPMEHLDFTATLIAAAKRQMEHAERYIATAFQTAQSMVAKFVRSVFLFFITLMVSAYLLITRQRVFAFFRSFVAAPRQHQFDDLLKRIDRGLSGVVRGQLLIALVNGILSGIGLYLLDIAYWPVLTVIATLLSVIPIFGAVLSTVPVLIFALQDGPATAALGLAWIVGIHQLEANVLNPKIMGDSAKVHPVLVVFSLLLGEHLLGIAGALLAVPVLSVTQSVFLHFREVIFHPTTGETAEATP